METITVLAFAVTGALLGSMVFFAAIVAPAAFQLLADDVRPRYLAGIFPRYYLWGIIVAALAAAAAFPVNTGAAVMLALIALAFIGVRQLLLPPINRARDGRAAGDPTAAVRFGRLHRISVFINLAQMIALIAVFVALAG
jgi:hypothetical protein